MFPELCWEELWFRNPDRSLSISHAVSGGGTLFTLFDNEDRARANMRLRLAMREHTRERQ